MRSSSNSTKNPMLKKYIFINQNQKTVQQRNIDSNGRPASSNEQNLIVIDIKHIAEKLRQTPTVEIKTVKGERKVLDLIFWQYAKDGQKVQGRRVQFDLNLNPD